MNPAWTCWPLIFALVLTSSQADDDDSVPDIETATSPTVVDDAKQGRFALILTPARQQAAGLQTVSLQKTAWNAQTKAYASVADSQPLFELRARFRAARSELTIAEAAHRVAGKNRERLSRLHRESIIPTRELIQAEAQETQEFARVEGARNRVTEVREATLQQWGEPLFKKLIAHESPLFRQLLERRLALILVTVTAPRESGSAAAEIRLAQPGLAQTERQARLVSAAPHSDIAAPGATWFYVADAAGLRTGQRLEAWLPDAGRTTMGVTIPLSAVLWHEGRPWVYFKTGDERFIRRAVDQHLERGDTWLVAGSYDEHTEVVIRGGQTLLSEELRQFIPDEDDD